MMLGFESRCSESVFLAFLHILRDGQWERGTSFQGWKLDILFLAPQISHRNLLKRASRPLFSILDPTV